MQRIVFPPATTAWSVYLQEALSRPAGGGYPSGDETEFVRVVRTGGHRPTKVTEAAQMTFECYGPDADVAEQLAADTSSWVYAGAGTRITGQPPVFCKDVENVSAPSYQRDPERPDLSRYTFTVLTALKGNIFSEGTAA